ncbi:MAG TPA: CBS domain-containing protein [Vicinamibacteria bacterium]|jgi:CBS domain-containing protein
MAKTIGELLEDRSDFYVVSSSDSVSSACQYMSKRNVGAVAVRDEKDHYCGVFSERDLLNKVVSRDADPHKTLVGDVMSRDLVTARPDENCVVAGERMEERETRHLLVLDGTRYLGMVTQRDLTNAFLDEVMNERDLLRRYASSELAE